VLNRLTRSATSRQRQPITWLILADIILSAIAILGSVALRMDGSLPILPSVGLLVLLAMVIQPAVNTSLGLHRQLWAYASASEYAPILLAVPVGTIATALVYYVMTGALGLSTLGEAVPMAFWVIVGLVNLILIGGIRCSVRLTSDVRRASSDRTTSPAVPTLLFGAGEVGAMMARSCRAESRAAIAPVGFLDDARSRHGRWVARLPVLGGLDNLAEAAAQTQARQLLITMPNAPGKRVREVVEAARAAGLTVRTVPAIWELLDGTVSAFRVRDVRVEDLLRREQLAMQTVAVDRIIRGRRVMITGAGGSIGSELARQVFAMRPADLILIDRAEGSLFGVEQELELLRRRGQAGGKLSIHLANVASRAVMQRIVRQTRPSIIFHAAAHKHVPMMEHHPSDAVQVNIGGTMSVLDAAVAEGVERFVFVSTDKAVKPSSVMGASKRIGEALVAQAARASGHSYVSVRFGNVLGSSGSVVPIFKKQLEDGEPLTITHPEMTRYFMTIPEAVLLVLDAASLGGAGDLLVLDMGEPVRIVDLATDLIRLSGRNPDSVPIEYVGVRPGEKLHEELFYDREGARPTANPRVLLVEGRNEAYDLRPQVAALLDMATGDADGLLRGALFELVEALETGELAPTARRPPRGATVSGRGELRELRVGQRAARSA
jgi:FlaA1/EpsC-like NDP-sugar epimerase